MRDYTGINHSDKDTKQLNNEIKWNKKKSDLSYLSCKCVERNISYTCLASCFKRVRHVQSPHKLKNSITQIYLTA